MRLNFLCYVFSKLRHSIFNTRYSIFTLILLCFLSCKTYQFNNFPEEQIIFGNGGGVTGVTVNYILLENGQLFKTNAWQKDTTELTKIKASAAKKYFKQLTDLDWEKIDVNEPGNTYHFLSYKTLNNTYRATWGATGYEPPEAIKSIYQSLRKELPYSK
ncbi:MAG: hypothetical protein AAF806_22445 [Bacteroidota bacterium]